MRKTKRKKNNLLLLVVFAAVCWMIWSIALKPSSPPPPKGHTRARFDLLCEFPMRTAAPGTEIRVPIRVRRIFDKTMTVELKTVVEGVGFTARTNRTRVRLGGLLNRNEGLVFVKVNIPASTREGARGHFNITGVARGETHAAHFRVEVVSSLPDLRPGKDSKLVPDQTWKAAAGRHIVFRLDAVNMGAARDSYRLDADLPPGWKSEFQTHDGKTINSVSAPGLNPRWLWEYTAPFRAVVTVPSDATPGKTYKVVFSVSSDKKNLLKNTAALEAEIFVPPPVFVYRPRVHNVPAGAETTWLLGLANRGDKPISLTLRAVPHGAAKGWKISVPDKTFILDPWQIRRTHVGVKRTTPSAPGETLTFDVEAVQDRKTVHAIQLTAAASNTPKTYFISIDSLNAEYFNLNAAADGPGRPGDRLMPNAHRLAEMGVYFSDARADLPSMTDMNHTNAACGVRTGTSGISLVGGYYLGRDTDGIILHKHPSRDDIRGGPNGDPAVCVFDMYKQNLPNSTAAIVSNKHWVTELLWKNNPNMDIAVHGNEFPVYVAPPERFVLGDPESDKNPRDRKAPTFMSMLEKPTPDIVKALLTDMLGAVRNNAGKTIGQIIGATPGKFPSDTWLMDAALGIVRAEDPDVMYVNLAALDETQHLMGAAWDPGEWNTRGTPALDDDVSEYNPNARRDDVIDMARHADVQLGRFLDALERRGALESSFIVFLADHGQTTFKDSTAGYELLDARRILRDNGILSIEDYGFIESNSSYVAIFDVKDRRTEDAIEAILENHKTANRLEKDGYPFIVLNKSEMKSGVEATNPRLRGRRIALPGELYSQWYVEHEGAPGDGLRWPDFIIFLEDNYQNAIYGEQFQAGINAVSATEIPSLDEAQFKFVGGHGGQQTVRIPLAIAGPGVKRGATSKRPATLADITPTLYSLLGWSAPAGMDGAPLPVRK